MKNRGFKVMLLSILFIIPLMLISSHTAGGPFPPLGFHWMGPAVLTELTFYPAGDKSDCDYWCEDDPDGLVWEGVATCQNQSELIELNCGFCEDFGFDELNEETIKNFLFAVDDVLSPDSPCIPDNKDIGGIAVQTVISFEDYTVQTPPLDMKKAKVIMLFVIPKKN